MSKNSSELTDKSKNYYQKQISIFQKIMGLGASSVWSPIIFIATFFKPALSLLPIGPSGSRQWAARNAQLAAQTLMMAAAAKGIDSCPMEGFSAPKVARLLGLQRSDVIPMIIALGYRADQARIESRWRRPINDAVVTH